MDTMHSLWCCVLTGYSTSASHSWYVLKCEELRFLYSVFGMLFVSMRILVCCDSLVSDNHAGVIKPVWAGILAEYL